VEFVPGRDEHNEADFASTSANKNTVPFYTSPKVLATRYYPRTDNFVPAGPLALSESDLDPRAQCFSPLQVVRRLNPTAATFYPRSVSSSLYQQDYFETEDMEMSEESGVEGETMLNVSELTLNFVETRGEVDLPVRPATPTPLDDWEADTEFGGDHYDADIEESAELAEGFGPIPAEYDRPLYTAVKMPREFASPDQPGFGPSRVQLQFAFTGLPKAETTAAVVKEQPLHHINFMGDYVPCKSDTAPALSLAILMMRPKCYLAARAFDICPRNYVVVTNAWKFVDPVVFFGSPLALQHLSASDLRDEATGQTAKLYIEYGAWTQDRYSEEDDEPQVDCQFPSQYPQNCTVLNGIDSNGGLPNRYHILSGINKAQREFERDRKEMSQLRRAYDIGTSPLRQAYTPESISEEADAEEAVNSQKIAAYAIAKAAAMAARHALPISATQFGDDSGSDSESSDEEDTLYARACLSNFNRQPLESQDLLKPTTRSWADLDDLVDEQYGSNGDIIDGNDSAESGGSEPIEFSSDEEPIFPIRRTQSCPNIPGLSIFDEDTTDEELVTDTTEGVFIQDVEQDEDLEENLGLLDDSIFESSPYSIENAADQDMEALVVTDDELFGMTLEEEYELQHGRPMVESDSLHESPPPLSLSVEQSSDAEDSNQDEQMSPVGSPEVLRMIEKVFSPSEAVTTIQDDASYDEPDVSTGTSVVAQDTAA